MQLSELINADFAVSWFFYVFLIVLTLWKNIDKHLTSRYVLLLDHYPLVELSYIYSNHIVFN